MTFCPVHNHSEFSALDGLSTMREIAERCVELEYPAVGLSDHGTVAGHLDFSKTMREHGIKPIFACEMYHGVNPTVKGNKRDQAHLLIGAMNDEGLKNLWRLSHEAATYFHHVPRVTWEMLKKYREGLFATTTCIQSLVQQELIENGSLDSLNRYLDIFGEDLYIELHTYPSAEHEQINHQLVQIAGEKGIPMTIANDAHFAKPEQYEIHDTYMACQLRESIYADPKDRKMWHPKALYIHSEDEIHNALYYLGYDVIHEAILTSNDLAERVSADLPEVRRHLPMFVPKDCPWVDTPPEKPATLLIDLVEKGLIDRYGANPPQEVWDRAEQELKVFLDAGLEHYFLQTWDMCRFCDSKNIRRGPGRGSAAGAIVAYALSITDIDPIKHGLVFERFYNAGREKGFPDVDNDLPEADRPKVRKYLAERWGADNVREIGTVARMMPLSACDKTWNSCDVTFVEKEKVKEIVRGTPDIEILGPDSIGWSEEIDPGKVIYVMDHVGNRIHDWVATQPVDRQPILERWLEIVAVVTSRVSHYGMHASGTVVSDTSLNDELPQRWVPNKKTFVTQFPMTDVDSRQFVKQDLLVVKNLDTLQEWEKLHGEVDWQSLDPDNHPVEMWELLDKGLTKGIFQIEDGYARHLCKEFKPRSIEDLAIIIALNRPGPIRSGAVEPFLKRRREEEEVEYDDEFLEDILAPTYGRFLYQEQIIAFFSKLGYSLSEADAVRKILGKKKPEALKELLQGEGVWDGKGYWEMTKEKIPPNPAFEIWSRIEEFAKYSFNKSHAVAYATLALRTLYAKHTAPAEFLIACLQVNRDRAPGYVAEGNRMGIKIKGPEIDRSGVDVEVHGGDIIFGFANIDGIGKPTAQYLLTLRDKYSLTSPEKLYEAVESEQKDWESDTSTSKSRSPRQRFRKNLYEVLYKAGCWDTYEDRNLTLLTRQKLESEYLKVILTDDSVETFARNSDKIAQCDDWGIQENGVTTFKLPGIITQVNEKKTKKDGKKMAIVTIEYEEEEMEFVVFPQQYAGFKFLWRERTSGIFDLRKTDRGFSFSTGMKLT